LGTILIKYIECSSEYIIIIIIIIIIIVMNYITI